MDAATKKKVSVTVKTRIYFKKLSNKEILNYIKSGEPFDKAGSYGPQGPGINLIAKMEGEFTNFLGLPMDVVYNALENLGVRV
jgi:septum formation protein